MVELSSSVGLSPVVTRNIVSWSHLLDGWCGVFQRMVGKVDWRVTCSEMEYDANVVIMGWSSGTAEWSFQYLRNKAQSKREGIIVENIERKLKEESIDAVSHHRHRRHQSYNSNSASKSSTLHATINGNRPDDHQGGDDNDDDDDDDDDDEFRSVSSDLEILDETTLYSINSEYNLLPGRLIISPNGLRFVLSLPYRREVWYRSFMELVEMKKVTRITSPRRCPPSSPPPPPLFGPLFSSRTRFQKEKDADSEYCIKNE